MYTTILHDVRRAFKISANDYCVADTIEKLSHNPKAPRPGWCSASRQYIADTLMLSRVTVINIIGSLEEKGLIERDPVTDHLKITYRWYEAVTDARQDLNAKKSEAGGVSRNLTPCKETLHPVKNLDTPPCKESLHPPVKKVYTPCKESLQEGVKNLDTINDSDNRVDNRVDNETNVGSSAQQDLSNQLTPAPAEKAPPLPPPDTPTERSPTESGPTDDLARFHARLLNEQLWLEATCVNYRISLDLLISYVNSFVLEKRQVGKVHRGFADFKANLTSWLKIQRDNNQAPRTAHEIQQQPNRTAASFTAAFQNAEPKRDIVSYGTF